MKLFLQESTQAAAQYVNTFDAPIMEAREAVEQAQQPFAAGGPQMASIDERWIQIGGRRILARHYRPTAEPNLPVIVFFHGGGWTWNSIDTHDRVAREYAARTGFSVVAPDYAMAPEYPFPTPLNECVQVIQWLSSHGHEWGVDGGRLAVSGDSAGANLALAACMMLRNTDAMPRAALLNYGAYDQSYDRQSYVWIGDSSLSPQTWKMKWFWRNYLQSDRSEDWRAVPLKGSFENLPPLRLQVGQLDVLRDENLELARAAKEQGVDAECIVYPGVTHGFLRAAGRVSTADRALQEGSDWLHAKLN
jgi:acetyl esterase